MKKRYTHILCSVLIAALLISTGACSTKKAGTDESSTSKTDAVSYRATLSSQTITAFPDAFVSGINQYGWTVVSQLFGDGNIAISPASL